MSKPTRVVFAESFIQALEQIEAGRATVGLVDKKADNQQVEVIVAAIRVKDLVTVLVLRQNQISNNGAKIIADYVRNSKTIRELNLGWNSIAGNGIIPLAEALKENKSMKKLILDKNEIGENGAVALANALDESSLIYLKLDRNGITISSLKAFHQVMKRNLRVTYLNLQSNFVFEDENLYKEIEDLLQRNKDFMETCLKKKQNMIKKLAMVPEKVMLHQINVVSFEKNVNLVEDFEIRMPKKGELKLMSYKEDKSLLVALKMAKDKYGDGYKMKLIEAQEMKKKEADLEVAKKEAKLIEWEAQKVDQVSKDPQAFRSMSPHQKHALRDMRERVKLRKQGKKVRPVMANYEVFHKVEKTPIVIPDVMPKVIKKSEFESFLNADAVKGLTDDRKVFSEKSRDLPDLFLRKVHLKMGSKSIERFLTPGQKCIFDSKERFEKFSEEHGEIVNDLEIYIKGDSFKDDEDLISILEEKSKFEEVEIRWIRILDEMIRNKERKTKIMTRFELKEQCKRFGILKDEEVDEVTAFLERNLIVAPLKTKDFIVIDLPWMSTCFPRFEQPQKSFISVTEMSNYAEINSHLPGEVQRGIDFFTAQDLLLPVRIKKLHYFLPATIQYKQEIENNLLQEMQKEDLSKAIFEFESKEDFDFRQIIVNLVQTMEPREDANLLDVATISNDAFELEIQPGNKIICCKNQNMIIMSFPNGECAASNLSFMIAAFPPSTSFVVKVFNESEILTLEEAKEKNIAPWGNSESAGI